jgi:DNA-binding response OmpR family regulator
MSMPQAVIVEDDFKLSELYKTVLEQCQYETTIIGSGREAQKKFQTSVPKLIVLDIHLPYISGLDLLKELQEDERFNNTLIIVVTADVYTANNLERKVKNVILKTYGINKLRRLATDHLELEV